MLLPPNAAATAVVVLLPPRAAPNELRWFRGLLRACCSAEEQGCRKPWLLTWVPPHDCIRLPRQRSRSSSLIEGHACVSVLRRGAVRSMRLVKGARLRYKLPNDVAAPDSNYAKTRSRTTAFLWVLDKRYKCVQHTKGPTLTVHCWSRARSASSYKSSAV